MIERKYISKWMLIISFAYFVFIMILNIMMRGTSNSLFDYLVNMRWGGSASLLTLTIGVLPLLVLGLPLLIDRFESDMIVIRIKRKRRLFYEHFMLCLVLSAGFTFLMIIGGIVASLLATGQLHNLWGTKGGTIYFLLENKAFFPLYIPHVSSIKVWSYIIMSRFLATLFLGVMVVFLKALLTKNSFVFFVSLILLGIDSGLPGNISYFVGRANISLNTWLSPGDQFFNLFYFVFLITVFSVICLKLYDKKEFQR